METFSALLALCAGNSPVPVNSPHKGQWRGALMFSLICVWINGWVNNREAGDLRRYRGHYDVTVMRPIILAVMIQQTTKHMSSWWRHQREIFSALLAFCAGNSLVTGEFPSQSQWRGALMFSFSCTQINGWVNNREAGDLRRYRAHCDVIVMTNNMSSFPLWYPKWPYNIHFAFPLTHLPLGDVAVLLTP